MAKQPLHGMLEGFIEHFAAAIAARAEALLSRRTAGAGKVGRPAKAGAARGVRMCPYPGCKNPGNGPRNRWFCKEHSKSVGIREQKRILAERAQSGGAALVVKAVKAAGKGRGANKGKKLDMRCRVVGCKNDSRGPRFGFICDDHRKKLSVKEQRDAREKWNTKKAA